MPSSSLQPHTFPLRFYSSFCLFLLLLFYRFLWPALLPAVCPGAFTRHVWGSSTLFPCPMSSEGHSLPAVCHLALLPAAQPAPHHPSAQENSAYEQQKSHRARITYQQNRIPAETPSPACFGAYACLPLALAREKAKRQRITVPLNKMALAVYLSSTHPSPLLQPNHTVFPEGATETRVLSEELSPVAEELLFRGAPGSCACACVHIRVCVTINL